MNVKIAMPMFSFYDKTGIEEYLQKQAENGWLLEKIYACFWKFKKVKPQRVKYNVVYLAKDHEFDSKFNIHHMNLIDYCEHTGWKFAGNMAQLHIFYSTDEQAMPIETDSTMELVNINKSYLRQCIPTYALFALLDGWFIFNEAFKTPIATLSSNCFIMCLL